MKNANFYSFITNFFISLQAEFENEFITKK